MKAQITDQRTSDVYATLDLQDGSRIKRACERWPLLETVHRVGSARRTPAQAASSTPVAAQPGKPWWEV